jgi:hypothetical protein
MEKCVQIAWHGARSISEVLIKEIDCANIDLLSLPVSWGLIIF